MRDPGRLRLRETTLRMAELVYRATAALPASERYGLSSQMRRAAVSIGSNVVEGCGRGSERQFLAFLQVAMGSLYELEFQTEIAARMSYLDPDEGRELTEAIASLRRQLGALVKVVRVRCRSVGD